MPSYAKVHLLDAPYCIDTAFDYYIPPNLRCEILCGDFVTVPFGNSNRTKVGLVVSLSDEAPNPKMDYKSVTDKCNSAFSLDEEALGLCRFLKEQTLCTVGDAVRAIVPTSAFTKLEAVFCTTEKACADIPSGEEGMLYDYIASRASASASLLRQKFGSEADKLLKKLEKSGLIKKEYVLKSVADKTVQLYSLCISPERAHDVLDGKDEIKLRSQKHAEILSYLLDADGECERSAIISACDASAAQLNALLSKGLIKCREKLLDRAPNLLYKRDCSPIILNDEQTKAYDTLCKLCDTNEAHGVLLHGVTGSGKTSVIMKCIDKVLSDGRTVIVLLPEISLTPQTLSIFCSRYEERVAIIHSALSLGERIDTYKKIKSGGADVVIGTRSAVFAPLDNIGLIVIDEEQEHTYKSDMNPKYHTRDVARFRAAHHGAVMLLASATPSFESYKKALDGTYTLIELKSRYGGAALPEAIIEDMRPELAAGNTSPIGSLLARKLIENTQNKNQSILFINRRGYNTFWSCRDCGEAIKCPTCSVSMTYHTSSKTYDTGYLACHWCGKRIPVPQRCPSCGSEHLSRMGFGTQRVEQELAALMPDAKILRMDTDTTGEKSAYEELLGKFRRHKADVLLGTQMVTKGHDFPDVTLVGVLLADASLYLDDYRASERTFAMLTQVIGRAGRAKKAGIAVIQTTNPEHECIWFACAQDFRAFYESEIRLRRLLVFPPFCDIALLTLTSPNEGELLRASALLSEKIRELASGEFSDIPLITYGPFEAPVYKVENKYRMRMVLKCKNSKRTRAFLSSVLAHFSGSGARGLSLSIDINPTNL